MKDFFRKRAFKKILNQASGVPFKGLRNAQRVMLLYTNDVPNKVSMVQLLEKHLEQYNLEVLHLGFIPVKLKKGEEKVSGFYYKNDLNWLGCPKQEVVQELTGKIFDVVIDLDSEIKSPNTFILLKLMSGLKMGFSNSKPYYDLVIEQKDNQEETLINQLDHYLNNIEKE